MYCSFMINFKQIRTEKENLFSHIVFKIKIYITYLIVIFKWENIFEIHVYDKRLISRVYKELHIYKKKVGNTIFLNGVSQKGISKCETRSSSDTKKCKLNPRYVTSRHPPDGKGKKEGRRRGGVRGWMIGEGEEK